MLRALGRTAMLLAIGSAIGLELGFAVSRVLAVALPSNRVTRTLAGALTDHHSSGAFRTDSEADAESVLTL